MGSPNKDLGPCGAYWNGVHVGPTLGGIKFKDDLNSEDLFEDGHGKTPVDSVSVGRITSVEVPMTRSSWAQLKAMIPGAVGGVSNLEVYNSVGLDFLALAKALVLKPLVNNVASVIQSQWLTIYRAYPVAAVEFTYDNATQRGVKVLFKVYPDDTSGNVGKTWRMGPVV